MHDSGTTAHLCNDSSLFLSDSVVSCDAHVYGVSREVKTPLVARARGDIKYHLDDGFGCDVILRNVLLVPDAMIADEGQQAVLVSTKLLARSGVGTHFVEGGCSVEFVCAGEIIGGFDTIDDGLYMDEQTIDVAACCPKMQRAFALRDDVGDVNSEQHQHMHESKHDDDKDSNDDERYEKKITSKNENKKQRKQSHGTTPGNAAHPGKRASRKNSAKQKQKASNGKEAQKSQLSKKARELLVRKLHQRIHYGKTPYLLNALKAAYGLDSVSVDDLPCDACAWAKARHASVAKFRTRPATRVGQRLHYDLFKGPCVTDEGYRWLLVVVDDFSGHVWCYGLRKKSETAMTVKTLVASLERLLGKRVDELHTQAGSDRVPGVACLRSDNARENVSNEMKEWCAERGTRIETSIAHTPHQNGRAERLGGIVWQGGAALRYGGNLPESDWVHCCQAFVHVKNRLPNKNALGKKGGNTAHELLHGVVIDQREMIDHFRTLGCLCYVVTPLNTRKGKPKRSFRAVMMGYTHENGQKGYKVRRLEDGEMLSVAPERVSQFFEFSLCFGSPAGYDAWLRQSIARRDGEVRSTESASEYVSESESDPAPPLASDSESDDGDGNESDDVFVFGNDGFGVADALPGGRLPAATPPPAGSPGEATAGDDLSEVKSSSDDDDEYEVDSILTFRRVGRKRGKIEYLTKWASGERTWEPPGSFKLDSVDPDNPDAKHLSVFENFKKDMADGKVFEFDPSADLGETGEEKSTPESLNEDINADLLNAMSNRIRVLKILVKGGVDVPQSRKQAMKSASWSDFLTAERTELAAFDEFDVWELVPRPSNANVVGVRWVYDVKVDELGNVLRYKARLVAQGFSQREGIDYNETFAPTMHIKTARALLAIAARDGVRVRQYDVSTAFLHADLAETVYVRQPEGHVVPGKEDYVYRLRKAMYGLKNAPKAYSDFFMGVLSKLGFTQSKKDECLWSFRKGSYYVHYLFHVDDILCVSNHDGMREACLLALQQSIRVRDEGDVSLFLGMKIDRMNDGSYTMTQSHYIERMAEKFNVNDNTKNTETPCIYGKLLSSAMCPATNDEKLAAAKLPFQSLVGGLIYAAKTRPDVAFAISDVARFMNCWGVDHFKAALRILRYLYATRNRVIHIKPESDDLVVTAFSDANWCDPRETGEKIDDKYKPQFGFVVFVSGVPVAWTSRRMQSRARSSMESEYYAADEVCKEVMFWRDLLDELGYTQTQPTQIFEDNKACIAYSKNNTCHSRTKHIDNRAYILRDHVRAGLVVLLHVDTNDQLADMMTKAQLKHTFIEHTDRIFNGTCTPRKSTNGGVRVGRVSVCHCLSCFVGGAVCEKSDWFDPVLSIDPHW